MNLPPVYNNEAGTTPDSFIRDERTYEVPADTLAHTWTKVTDKLLAIRQTQLRELGVDSSAIEDQLGGHLAVMDMIRTNLDNENENFISFLSELERAALEQSDSTASYGLYHTSQLDALVNQVAQLS